MRLKLKQLEHFHVLVEEKHFGRAALRLHVDQSSVSKSIKALELELGTLLFHREYSNIRLTKEGEIYFEETKNIIDALENAKRKALSALEYNKLKLAVPYCIDVLRLSQVLRFYRQEHPEFNIGVVQTDDIEMFDGLRSGRYDLALSYSHESKSNFIQYKAWEDELITLLPIMHPLVERKSISIHDLSNYTLICFNKSSAMQQQIFALLKNSNIVIKKIEFAKSYDLMLALVSAGFGAALLTETIFKNMKNENVVSRPVIENQTISTYVFSLGMSKYLVEFNKIVKRLYA